jgi:hypothetical protein
MHVSRSILPVPAVVPCAIERTLGQSVPLGVHVRTVCALEVLYPAVVIAVEKIDIPVFVQTTYRPPRPMVCSFSG